MTKSAKKLIEVALPLDAINTESLRRKQKAPKGWPTSFHKWWAQRPLAAARAVIFAQTVDDPSSRPDLFPTEEDQRQERDRLFRLIEELVKWENSKDQAVASAAHAAIKESWKRACEDNANHPQSKELFDPESLPSFLDPFAGGGSLPLSAQWLGLDSVARDINPVAVVLNKALAELPHRFSDTAPVNPDSNSKIELIAGDWPWSRGLAEDVRFYAQRMRELAEARLRKLYPKVLVTSEMARGRDDLAPYLGRELEPIAYIWARTVQSPNPAFSHVRVPLASTFVLSNKKGREVFVEPVVGHDGYAFEVRLGKAPSAPGKRGTKRGRGANFECVMSGAPINGDYIMAEGRAGRMSQRMMAIVLEGDRGRLYVPPSADQEELALSAEPVSAPEVEFFQKALGFRVGNYGMSRWCDLFSSRQLVALEVLSDLVKEIRPVVQQDALRAGRPEGPPLREGGSGATAYADAVAVYLACLVDRVAYYGSTLVGWMLSRA